MNTLEKIMELESRKNKLINECELIKTQIDRLVIDYQREMLEGKTLSETIEEREKLNETVESVEIRTLFRHLVGKKNKGDYVIEVKMPLLSLTTGYYEISIIGRKTNKYFPQNLPSKYQDDARVIKNLMEQFVIKYSDPVRLGTELINSRL